MEGPKNGDCPRFSSAGGGPKKWGLSPFPAVSRRVGRPLSGAAPRGRHRAARVTDTSLDVDRQIRSPHFHDVTQERFVIGEKVGFVFLSYASDDRDDAGKLVDALRARGVELWWDVDRRHEADEWGPDIDNKLESAHRILALVTRNVIESPRDFVFAEMSRGRLSLKLVALEIGDLSLPYKYQSVMIGLNRRAFKSFDQLLEPAALDDICAACLGTAASRAPPAGTSNPLGNDVRIERVALAVATAAR